MKLLPIAAVAALLSTAVAMPAQAANYVFSFSDGNATLDAYGTLTTSNVLNTKGGYNILSVTGFVFGQAISVLVPTSSPGVTSSAFGAIFDNVLYSPQSPHLDGDGLEVAAGGLHYNFYNAGSEPQGDVISSFNGVSHVHTIGTFAIQSALPEPASWAMMILGMGAVGFAMRSAKRRSDEKFDAKIKKITSGAIA